MRLLVVEDNPALQKSLRRGLAEEGFSVDVAQDGTEALHLAGEIAYDGILLDRMLPGLDGLSVLSRLRAQGVKTPVLMLTALGEIHDRVAGLDSGADDYLVKPFAFEELLARLRVLLRRGHGSASNRIDLGPLTLDLAARTASVHGQRLDLTAREYALLQLFALNQGKALTRSEIVEHLYDEESDRDSNVIDVFIARLRKKLDATGLSGAALIRTQRGVGYVFDAVAAGLVAEGRG